MKKFWVGLLCVALLMTCFTALADDAPVKIVINGEELVIPEGDTQPFIEEGRTLVPMRAIFEALGASVNWDGDTRTIISYDPTSDVTILMQIGNEIMFIDSTPVKLDVPAKIVNDRTVVPVRAIAEGMHSEVNWDGDTKTVSIEKEVHPAGGADMPNPWEEYATIDELNDAIQEKGVDKYVVASPANPLVSVKENGFRYLPDANITEIAGFWEVGEGAEFYIRTIGGDMTGSPEYLSGVYGAVQEEQYTLSPFGETVTVYRYDESTVYAIWSDSYVTHTVLVVAGDWDPIDVVKTLVDDVEETYPKA